MTTRDWGLLALRIGLGLTFFLHGFSKLYPSGPPAGFVQFVGRLGFPVPILFAWIVALLETVGAVAIISGLLTRWVGALMVIEMLVTTLRVKVPGGVPFIAMNTTGWELDFLLGVIALALALMGAGALSLDAVFGRRKEPSPARG
jgi:putative oxidoreductase